MIRKSRHAIENPFFRHFEPPKGHGRVCHRYIRKVINFGLFWIIIFRSNSHFSVVRVNQQNVSRTAHPPLKMNVKVGVCDKTQFFEFRAVHQDLHSLI